MNTQKSRRSILQRTATGVFLLVVFLVFGSFGSLPISAQAPEEPQPPVAQIQSNGILWELPPAYSGAFLTVSGPDGISLQREFSAKDKLRFTTRTSKGLAYPDGVYGYELRFYPQLSREATEALASAGEAQRESVMADLQKAGLLPERLVVSGNFSIQQGRILTNALAEEAGERKNEIQGDNQIMDVLHYDDTIVVGSLCVGQDCSNGESFGFDTERLKENNLRIHFQDTSATASFPTTDWRIIINDSANGGSSYFAIEDSDSNHRPFLVEANGQANAFYVEDTGDVGFGTSQPAVELHVAEGDTPALRLDQDGSAGWPAQSWDVAGNEANFFIRDVTNGSKLPFRIQPGAPTSSIYIGSSGNVGLGTASPSAQLHIEGIDNVTPMVVRNFSDKVILELDANGNLTLAGALTEASDVNVKENFTAVNNQDVLSRIANLSISTWNYIADGDELRHMGPMAQDFYAHFGLGADDTHIAPLDVDGVILAGMQELIEQTEAQAARIQQLEQENEDLEQRLADLEVLVGTLLTEQED